ncbi:MAG: potassium-transporting ATPase subunit KdpC [Candidatus Omnitrophica bacterium]|nr:potassium-transporting ATPase subunit KdpC [Candidatus Omnitrophota bacterium]
MFKHVITSIKMLLILMILTGVVYPLIVTGISQVAFNRQANGSPIVKDGKVIGSELVGQYFDDPKYFWGRPSATSPAYNASASSGSNLGPTNKVLIEAVEGRVKILHESDPANTLIIPADLVTASGSGLDPHISVEAAKYQVSRVSRIRGLAETELSKLVDTATEDRFLGVFGQPRVNVLKLNLVLDNLESR